MKARKDNLDILKAVCACLVITIHCPSIFMPQYVEATTRIAVPMFFAISGYFYISSSFRSTLKKSGRLILILAVTELFYAVMYIAGGQADKVKAAIDNGITNILLGRFILWLPGWFLLVLAYTYIMAYFIERIRLNSFIIIIVSAAFIILQWLDPGDFNSYTVFLRGLPCFMTGSLVRKYEDRLRKIPVNAFIYGSVFFEIMVLAEKFLSIRTGQAKGATMYLGTIPLMICLFCAAVFREPLNAPFLKYVGRKLSMYMYCLHIAVMSVLSRMGLEYESLWLCLISIICAFIVSFLINTFSDRFKKTC